MRRSVLRRVAPFHRHPVPVPTVEERVRAIGGLPRYVFADENTYLRYQGGVEAAIGSATARNIFGYVLLPDDKDSVHVATKLYQIIPSDNGISLKPLSLSI